jgi:hypothetical protein
VVGFDNWKVVWMPGNLIERHVTLAAITAAAAALAQMVIAGVFGAKGTDFGGLLLTDAARKRH